MSPERRGCEIAGRRRTAVVTGAGGGIGGAIARRLAAEGDRVVLVGRTRASLEVVAADVGANAVVLAADVTDLGWLDALAEVAPAVDVVVHAAAAYAPFATLESTDDDAWRRVFDVGPTAAMRLLKRVLPGMKARGFGRVVLIGSVAATLGAHGQAAYAAAKAALVGLTRAVALESARNGVTVNLVEPGIVDTARVRSAVRRDTLDALSCAAPAGRLGEADEVGAVVAFLCGIEAGYVTGAVVPVTGGLGLGLTAGRSPAR
jgi:3-oxoacyl-[acyl-carrier protein] reductase